MLRILKIILALFFSIYLTACAGTGNTYLNKSELNNTSSNNKVFVVTNKPYKISKKALIYFGLYNFFDDIFTSDGNTDNCNKWSTSIDRNKSNYLSFIDDNYGGTKFYTGDTESDYLATLGSSFKFVYAKYGYGKSFILNKDSLVLESFKEFKKYI